MKKALSLFLAVIMMLTATACGRRVDMPNTDRMNSPDAEVKDTGRKIQGEIQAATVFKDGLAFVELTGVSNKTYCINKEGNIVFEINEQLSAATIIYEEFVNGLAFVNEGFYDAAGNFTMPADVGATKFYGQAVSAGYIIAEVITADYTSTSKKLGVLDTNFQWTVEPSEELYDAFSKSNGGLAIESHLYTQDCVVGDVYYNYNLGKTLNLKTGEVTKGTSALNIDTSDSSVWYYGRSPKGYYNIIDDTLVLDLSDKGSVSGGTSFVNGRAAILYYNEEADRHYVTIIDVAGNHLFEPVETKYSSVEFDGEYILVKERSLGEYGEVFNDKGEKTWERSATEGKLSLSDGVILVDDCNYSLGVSGQVYMGKSYYLDVYGNRLF